MNHIPQTLPSLANAETDVTSLDLCTLKRSDVGNGNVSLAPRFLRASCMLRKECEEWRTHFHSSLPRDQKLGHSLSNHRSSAASRLNDVSLEPTHGLRRGLHSSGTSRLQDAGQSA